VTDASASRERENIESNEKYLLVDVAHIEDKTRLGEYHKQLRDEKDRAFGIGEHISGGDS
jgi:hypothetical protein